MSHTPSKNLNSVGSNPLELALLGLPKTSTTWLGNLIARNSEVNVFDESNKIEHLWRKHQSPSIVIAESVTDPLFLGGIAQRQPTLDSLGKRLKIHGSILVLREPLSWIGSLYRQYIKRGGFLSVREFLGTGDDAVVDPSYVDYNRLIQEIRSSIDGPLIICDYTSVTTNPRNFIKTIVNTFNESIFERMSDSLPNSELKKRANVGIRGIGAQAVRTLNRFRRTRWNPDGWIRFKRLERLPWHLIPGPDKDIIRSDDWAWIASQIREHNDWDDWSEIFSNSGARIYESHE